MSSELEKPSEMLSDRRKRFPFGLEDGWTDSEGDDETLVPKKKRLCLSLKSQSLTQRIYPAQLARLLTAKGTTRLRCQKRSDCLYRSLLFGTGVSSSPSPSGAFFFALVNLVAQGRCVMLDHGFLDMARPLY